MGKRMFPNVPPPSTEVAFNVYHNNTYLQTTLIRELFACSYTTANKIRQIVLEEMKEREIELYHIHTSYIDKDVLYEMAGLDINRINKSYKAICSIQKRG